MPDPIKFVEQKNQYQILRSTVKNWERKIEIAEIAAKKAKGILKQSGVYVDDVLDENHQQLDEYNQFWFANSLNQSKQGVRETLILWVTSMPWNKYIDFETVFIRIWIRI